jgi:hypothetical protein
VGNYDVAVQGEALYNNYTILLHNNSIVTYIYIYISISKKKKKERNKEIDRKRNER